MLHLNPKEHKDQRGESPTYGLGALHFKRFSYHTTPNSLKSSMFSKLEFAAH